MSQEFTTTFWHFILGLKVSPQCTMLENPTVLFFPLSWAVIQSPGFTEEADAHSASQSAHFITDSSTDSSPLVTPPTVHAATFGSESPSPDCKDAYRDRHPFETWFLRQTDLFLPLPALTNILLDRISFFNIYFYLGTFSAAQRRSCGTRDL